MLSAGLNHCSLFNARKFGRAHLPSPSPLLPSMYVVLAPIFTPPKIAKTASNGQKKPAETLAMQARRFLKSLLYLPLKGDIFSSGGVGHGSRDFIRPITRCACDANGGRRSFGLYVNLCSFSINFFCYRAIQSFIFGKLLEDILAKLWFKRQVQVSFFINKTRQ